MLIVDPWHWLEPSGELPTENLRLRSRVISVLRVVEYGAALERGMIRETLIECKKRPGGRRCTGLLHVEKTDDDGLLSFCPECGTQHMFVHNWQGTKWARATL